MSSGRTTRAQVPYPLTSDAANVATDIAAIANFIDLNVPLWATTSGSAPTPSVNSTGGELWWCTQAGSNYGLNYYNGTSWINIGAGLSTAGGDLTGTYPNPTLNSTTNVENIISANTTVAGALQKSGGTMTGLLNLKTVSIAPSSGTTQGSNALTGQYNTVSATGAYAVTLPSITTAGEFIYIDNNSAYNLSVFPATGQSIDGAGTNAAIVLAPSAYWLGWAETTTSWASVVASLNGQTGVSVTYGNGTVTFSGTPATTYNSGDIVLSGDLAGTGTTASSPKVSGIQGVQVSSAHATILSQSNYAETRSTATTASAPVYPGEETVVTASTANIYLPGPALPVGYYPSGGTSTLQNSTINTVLNSSTGTVNIYAASTNAPIIVTDGNASSSYSGSNFYPLPAGCSIQFVYVTTTGTTGTWYAISQNTFSPLSVTQVNSSSVVAGTSLLNNPNVQMQIGYISGTTNGAGALTITFPTPFQNGCFGILPLSWTASGGSPFYLAAQLATAYSTSGGQIIVYDLTSGSVGRVLNTAVSFTYLAFGC